MSVREVVNKDGTVSYQARRFMGYKADGKPDQRSRTYKTKRAAELADAKMLAERDAMRGRSGKMTLSQYIDNRYWPVASKRLAATSLDTYEKEVRLRIRPILGGKDIRDITRKDVQSMVDAIPTESVARKSVGVLKTILNEAKADGIVSSNPAEATFALPPKGGKRDNGVVLSSFAQILSLLDDIADEPQSVQRIAYTGLLQGLRPEERYALNWSDVDVENGLIRVSGAYVTASSKHGGRQLKGTKTERSNRVVPMHPSFREWAAEIPCGGGPFILGADGKRISPSTAQKQWRRCLRTHPGIPKVTIENMRHSFATSYLNDGGSIEVLSRLLGHANISTTINRYYRPDVDVLRNDLFSRM